MEPVTATQLALLLHSLPGMGEKSFAASLRFIAQHRLTPDQVLAHPHELRRCGVSQAVCESIEQRRADLVAQSGALARMARDRSLQIFTITMAAYPARLIATDASPPPILYALGQTGLIEPAHPDGGFTFAIAVSNGADAAVLARLERIAAGLVEQGGIPITGHDRAPYQRVALCAQRQDRPAVYVLDRGLRSALGPDLDRSPFAAARIRDPLFVPQRDLALSPFRLDDHAIGANNRRRDGIVFALADVTVALYVRPGGSMAAVCERVAAQGRPVFAAVDSMTAGSRTLPLEDEEAVHAVASQARAVR
jgi:predicted Rossmann fold nucleotide-binding protein DprA/Smf involved in DNA uptake